MNNKFLVIVDMQNDFITGSLGSKDAQAIVTKVIELSKQFDKIIFTKDIHYKNYLSTLEGKKLPVKHCMFHSEGAKIVEPLRSIVYESTAKIEEVPKSSFGSFDIRNRIWDNMEPIELEGCEWLEIHLCGLLTDICVISNALILRNQFPNAEIYIHKDCCAGSSVEKHNAALAIADSCHINVI